ncbi:MAG: InlB B-repeat-containing protein [Lachnospiraceae bacterium]|nr:InlB B-repeat-containing protein [Lachnospiraceae bacterium]
MKKILCFILVGILVFTSIPVPTLAANKGWQQDGSGNWYYYIDDDTIATGLYQVNGKWYYFDDNGMMKTGWQKIDIYWYYFAANGKMVTGWLPLGTNMYYMAEDGKMVTGWQTIEGKTYYFNASGKMLRGEQTIDGEAYTFGDDGALIENSEAGWYEEDGKMYYYLEDGTLAVGFMDIDGSTYYFLSDGSLKVGGWGQIGGSWYYFATDGKMVTGWLPLGTNMYYMAEDGKMVTGWQTIEGKTYYFNASGKMLRGEQTIDGEVYIFGDDGELIIESQYTITYNTCSEDATFPDGTTSYTTYCDGGIYYVGEGVPEPTLAGHRFIGWGDSWRNNDMVTAVTVDADHIFNAIWEESCDVVYNANGGHFYNGETSQTDYGVEPGRYSINWEEPEREGYVFIGWSSDINGTCLGRTVNLTKSATFYAQWDPAYAITYDANGGEWDFGYTDENGDPEPAFTTHTEYQLGGYYWIGWHEPMKEGYEFDGWTVNGNKVNRVYLTGNITVKATWREAHERVTVTYNANGGYWYEYDENDNYITVKTSEEEVGDFWVNDANGERNQPWIDDNHRFAGWSTDQNAKDVECGYNYVLTEDTTFYAIYIPYSETLHEFTYDANGGEICLDDGTWADSRVEEEYLGRYWICDFGLRREGYDFMGWTSYQRWAAAGKVEYEVGDKLLLSRDTTIYAVWHKRPTITYHANGGNWGIYERDEEVGDDVLVGTRDTEVHYGDAGRYYRIGCWIEDSYVEHVDDGSEEGYNIKYEFIGWYDAATGGNRVDDTEILIEDGADFHYYAHWRKLTTVHYVSDISKGSWWNNDTQKYDIVTFDRDACVGDTYYIDGWTPNSPDDHWEFIGYSVAPNAAEAEYQPYEEVLISYDNISSLNIQTLLVSDKTEDVYLYAVWKKNPVVRYHDGDDEGESNDYSSWPNGDNGYREHILSAGYHYYFGEEFPEMGHWEARHWIMYDDKGEPVIMDDEMIVPSYGDEYDLYPDWVKVIGITYDANGGLFLDENGNEAWNSESGETSGEVHYRNQRQDDEEWLDGWRPNKVEYEYGDNGEVTNEIHYEFVGWSKDPDFVFDSSLDDPYAELIWDEDYKMLSDYGEAGTADDAVTFPELEEGFFITLYAVYAPKLTIIYDANGGGWNWDGESYKETVRVQNHNYDEETYNIGEWWPERYQYPYNQETGEYFIYPVQYRFIGWSLDKNATDAVTDWEIDLASLGTVKVYAIWAQPIQIPIDFAGGQFCYDSDEDGNPLYDDSVTMYQIEGDYITVYDLNRNFYPEKEGCEFIGWSVGYTNDNGSANGSENGSENNDPVIFVPIYNGVRVRSGMIIRAEWVNYDYPEVHLALDGGVLWGNDAGDENGVIILTPSNRGAYRYSGVLYPGEIGIPYKDGYHFAGWRTENGVFPSKITVTQDISLYATWIDEEGDETFEKDNVIYKMLDDGNLEVIEYKGSSYSVTIPDSINDMNITEIGAEAFMDNSTLTSIRIPDSVVSIGARAFKNCSNLNEITNGSGICVIEAEAFRGCNLEEFRLSAAATTIETCAFADCSNLSEFSFGGLEGYLGTDYDLDDLREVVGSLAVDAFEGCPFTQPVGLRAQSDTVYCYVPNPSYGDKVVLIPYVQSTVEDDTYYYLYSEDGENYTKLEEGDVSIIRNLEYTPACEKDTYLYFRLVVGDYSADVVIEIIATDECPECSGTNGDHEEWCSQYECSEVDSFTLSFSSRTFIAGQGTRLEVDDKGVDRTITWMTENANIVKFNEINATDEDGKLFTGVCGVSRGTAKVTATDQYGNTQKAVISVVEVTLSSGDVELSPCETMQLSATVIGPDGNTVDFGWFTDDSDIARIDENGLIVAESFGEVNLGVEIPGVGKKWIKVTVGFG